MYHQELENKDELMPEELSVLPTIGADCPNFVGQ